MVKLVDLTEMRKTDCCGETRLVPHVPSWKAILLLFVIKLSTCFPRRAHIASGTPADSGLYCTVCTSLIGSLYATGNVKCMLLQGKHSAEVQAGNQALLMLSLLRSVVY